MPITQGSGLLTSANDGIGTSLGERVLVDYKDALGDYKATDLDVISMFSESMTTDTGGDIDLTFALPSMKMESIDEGSTPAYQHTKLRSERVSVKEWGIAVGVTRRMIEDSRFNEVELALNEARKAVDRHITDHFVKCIFGVSDSTFGTLEIDADTNTAESTITTFASNPHGGFLGSGGSVTADGTRVYEYGNALAADLTRVHYANTTASAATGTIGLVDILHGIDVIGAHGYSADTLLCSPSHFNSLLKLADFTTVFTAGAGASVTGVAGDTSAAIGNDRLQGTFAESTNKTRVIGQIFGLNIVANAWVPKNQYGIFDSTVKPVAYVERRGLTVEEANPGFGIVGSYLSMRYGLKIINPLAGFIYKNQ
jgi:hypothetical protein